VRQECHPEHPTGYTLVGTFTSGNSPSSDKVALYRRTAQTGDSTVTVTFGSSSAAVATLAVYRGVNPSSPIDATGASPPTSGPSVTAPSITTTIASDQLLLVEGAKYSGSVGSFTQPNGMTSRVSDVAGTQLTGAIADQPLNAIGATGPRTATFSFSATLVAVAVALKPAQTTYTYNTRGDRTSVTKANGTVTNVSHDQLDRMLGYGANSTYTYNGDGLRMNKTVSGNSEAFTWDTNTSDGIPRPLVDGTTSYVYDPQGHSLEQITSGGTVNYYLHDQIGSTRLLRSSSATTVASYTYDAYGNLAGTTGSATNPLGYVGAYTDSESGAAYLINRYYGPATAVFITVDPIVDETNQPYNYAGQDPVDRLDRAGLSEEGHGDSGPIGSGDPGSEGRPTPVSKWSIPGLGYSVDEAFQDAASTIGKTRRADASKLFKGLKDAGFEVGKTRRGDGTRAYDTKGRSVILEPNDGKAWHSHLGRWYWRVTYRGIIERYTAR
jgi:RHS repeat-associated protein